MFGAVLWQGDKRATGTDDTSLARLCHFYPEPELTALGSEACLLHQGGLAGLRNVGLSLSSTLCLAALEVLNCAS